MNVRLLTQTAQCASRYRSIRSISAVASRTGYKPTPTTTFQQKAAFAAMLASVSAATATAYAEYQKPSTLERLLEDDTLSVLSRSEPQTGVQFPLALSHTENLHGTGVRLMGGLVRVYAIGFYVDAHAARGALADWEGFSRKDLLASDPFWDAICDAQAPFQRTFRMVVVREVGGKHMKDGFDRGIKPRVAAAIKKGKCKPAECRKSVSRFSDLFISLGTMKVGSEVRITLENGSVSLTVDGRWLGVVKNAQLAWAMADMFLGQKAVAPTLRQSSAEALEALLEG